MSKAKKTIELNASCEETNVEDFEILFLALLWLH